MIHICVMHKALQNLSRLLSTTAWTLSANVNTVKVAVPPALQRSGSTTTMMAFLSLPITGTIPIS